MRYRAGVATRLACARIRTDFKAFGSAGCDGAGCDRNGPSIGRFVIFIYCFCADNSRISAPHPARPPRIVAARARVKMRLMTMMMMMMMMMMIMVKSSSQTAVNHN